MSSSPSTSAKPVPPDEQYVLVVDPGDLLLRIVEPGQDQQRVQTDQERPFGGPGGPVGRTHRRERGDHERGSRLPVAGNTIVAPLHRHEPSLSPGGRQRGGARGKVLRASGGLTTSWHSPAPAPPPSPSSSGTPGSTSGEIRTGRRRPSPSIEARRASDMYQRCSRTRGRSQVARDRADRPGWPRPRDRRRRDPVVGRDDFRHRVAPLLLQVSAEAGDVIEQPPGLVLLHVETGAQEQLARWCPIPRPWSAAAADARQAC